MSGNITTATGSVVTALKTITIDPVAGSVFTLDGTLDAPSISVIGGSGDDTVNLSLAGLEGNLSLDGGAGQNSLNLQGTNNNQFLLNDHSIVINGLRHITTSNLAQLAIDAGTGNNTFDVLGTLAGTNTSLAGDAGSDTFWIGSNGSASGGSLDSILGAVAISGGGGSDQINVDDRAAVDAKGKALAADYIVTPTQVAIASASAFPQRSFAGITYDSSTTQLTLLASAAADQFLVKPSQITNYILDGNVPKGKVHGTDDTILLDLTGTTGAKLKHTIQGAGTWSFAKAYHAIQFTGIKLFHTQKLSAVAGGAVVTKATSAATFTVTYHGLTLLDLAYLVGNNAAVQVTGPGGYSQLARLRERRSDQRRQWADGHLSSVSSRRRVEPWRQRRLRDQGSSWQDQRQRRPQRAGGRGGHPGGGDRHGPDVCVWHVNRDSRDWKMNGCDFS